MRSYLPLEVEFLLVNAVSQLTRLFASSYKVSRYLIDGQYIGRVICVLRTPIDYMYASKYPAVNKDILQLIKSQNQTCGTRYFGLGNLNKMKQLNDGGALISTMIANDVDLKNKGIRIWTGDTMTAASVYNQIIAIPNLKKIFYIGANGKIGNAVCRLLVERNIHICIFSKYEGIKHSNITYTHDLKDICEYKFCLIGKILRPSVYKTAFKGYTNVEPTYLLDYTVPFMPLELGRSVRHVQIGVLKTTNSKFLQGSFDVCFGIDENNIYPCHAGCIVNFMEKRETDETGEIDLKEIAPIWQKAISYGLQNKTLDLD